DGMCGGGGNGGFYRGDVGPVVLVFGTLLDPALEDLLFARGELAGFLRRRHGVVGIAGEQAFYHFAFGGFAGDDGADAVIFRERAVAGVEAAVGFALVFVEPVAANTGVVQDGASVLIVPVFFRHRG